MESVPRPKNRTLYMYGFVLTGLGLLLVLPVVIALIPGLGPRAAFMLQAGSVVRALCGIGGPVLIVTGFGLMAAGSPGLGAALTAEADELFESTSSETPLGVQGRSAASPASTQGSLADREVRIMIRCRDCRGLNPESEKHCQTCGAEL